MLLEWRYRKIIAIIISAHSWNNKYPFFARDPIYAFVFNHPSYLLQGADPNCLNKDSVPVLHVAVKNNHADAIPVLVQEGADVNKKAPRYVFTSVRGHSSVT